MIKLTCPWCDETAEVVEHALVCESCRVAVDLADEAGQTRVAAAA